MKFLPHKSAIALLTRVPIAVNRVYMETKVPLISLGTISEIYSGTFIEVTPIATPMKTLPNRRSDYSNEYNDIKIPPIMYSKSAKIMMAFLPHLSMIGPEMRAPKAEPNAPSDKKY